MIWLVIDLRGNLKNLLKKILKFVIDYNGYFNI